MANAKEIKRKISSVSNTGKITKAMELISTVKMKKAQDLALEKRKFVFEMLKIFLKIEDYLAEFPLFSEEGNVGEKTLGVIITSNKGLCGGYNINVMKKVNEYVQKHNSDIDFIAVGKKGAQFIARTGHNLIADFSEEFSDHLDPIFTKKISQMMREEYLSGKYGKVVVFYNFYVNTIKQISVGKVSLPIESVDLKEYLTSVLGDELDLQEVIESMDNTYTYTIEPNKDELMRNVIPMILDMIFFDTLLNAKASEHSARMVAMKNAKDSAKKIASNLKRKYNKARQSMITTEVSEITAGVEALKD